MTGGMNASNDNRGDPWARARAQMVAWQIEARNVRDPRVLRAMGELPRERFVPAGQRDQAYEDRALPIGCDQTISQPYMVALMTEKLSVGPDDRVLEIGTGSGYQLALLAMLAGRVYTVECQAELAAEARSVLEELGLVNVEYRVDDGSLGWPEHAPYDRIMVTAGAPEVPEALVEQLTDGGIMVIPVGPEDSQTLLQIRKDGQAIRRQPVIACRFVKLRGNQGWPES